MTMTYWYVKSVKSIDCKSYSLKTLGFPHRFVRFEWVEFTGGSPHGGPGWTSSVYWLVDIPMSFLVGNIRSFCEGWMGESAFFWRKGWVGIYIYTQYPVHLEKGKREHVFTSLLLKYLLGNSNLIIPLSFMFQYAQYAPVGMRAWYSSGISAISLELNIICGKSGWIRVTRPGKRLRKTTDRSTIFNGKTHYNYGHVQ